MYVAIPADSKDGLDSPISQHFGRCPYFVIVEVEGTEIKGVRAVDNPYSGGHEPGQIPTFVKSQGAEVVITGGMGGRALAFFEQQGIEAVSGASGTVRQALELYLGGELRGFTPCHEHGDCN